MLKPARRVLPLALQPTVANALPRSYGTRNSSLALISFREAGLAGVGSQVRL